MPTIQIKDYQLEYIEQGQGEPVVLVHGTLGDYRSWQLQMDVFAEKYRTISYSRRYHYPNQCEGNESDYSAALHADDLADFIKGLGLDSAHIVGNSYGAYTALFLAARHPERVRTLVLGEPPILPLIENHPEGRKVRDEFMKKTWEPAGEMLKQGKIEDGIKVFVDGVVQEGAFDQFPPEIKKPILDNGCEFKAEHASPGFWTPFTCEEAGKITASTMLMAGDKSIRMLQLIVDELDRCLPNNESVRVPDSTHELPADNTQAYNEIVLGFIDKHSS